VDIGLVALILGELAFAAFVLWLLVRRGQEKARLRAEVNSRLIDRCGSAEELARFLDSDGGRRLLEAISPGRSSSPAWAIVATVQGGVVLLVLGLALLYAIGLDKVEARYTLQATVILALGGGLLLAGELSERLSRRYGLLPGGVQKPMRGEAGREPEPRGRPGSTSGEPES
jgi:hypothetical protein